MTLAERAAAAKPEETVGLLRELAGIVRPNWDISSLPWTHAFCALEQINTPESLFAAAMMLRPPRWGWSVKQPSEELPMFIKQDDMPVDGRLWLDGEQFQGIAATPALALIAAIATSKGV